jgi:cation diffusion facilitator family transporter
VFGSLVLLADAGHLPADVCALSVSAVASGLARRHPTVRHTFGFERAEVLAAQVNALLLAAVMAWIAGDAIGRLASPPPVRAAGMLAVAVTALVMNGVSLGVAVRRRTGVKMGGGTARDVVCNLVRWRPRVSLTPGTGVPGAVHCRFEHAGQFLPLAPGPPGGAAWR